MNQDAALDKWLEAELPVASFNTRLAVCAAWRAATKHTLAFVVSELHKDAWHEGKIKFETIEAISKMKP